MIEHVVFTPEADEDVMASYNWYETREPGLGDPLDTSVSFDNPLLFAMRFSYNRANPENRRELRPDSDETRNFLCAVLRVIRHDRERNGQI